MNLIKCPRTNSEQNIHEKRSGTNIKEQAFNGLNNENII